MKHLYLLLWLCCLYGYGQTTAPTKLPSDTTKKDSLPPVSLDENNTFLRNLSVASPTASALGKYADVSVDTHNGLPQIPIVLTELKGKQLRLPISLSYHASGIKVAELASWVGLGWSLNAGGVISRQVMGGPDETYLGDKGQIPDLSDITVSSHASGFYNDYGFSLPTYIYQSDGGGSYEKHDKFLCAGLGYLDTEPDIFSFNVGGQAGKFYFDAQRVVHFIPENDFKVEVIYTGNPVYEFDSFILVASDGTRYYFGGSAYEKTSTVAGNGLSGGSYLKSSWYLYKIESADRSDVIDLTYVKEGYSFSNTKSERYEDTQNVQKYINSPLFPYFADRTSVDGLRLVQIQSAQMQVDFVATTTRLDVSSNFNPHGNPMGNYSAPKRLDEVRIRSKSDASEGIKFKLTYDYYEAVAPNAGTVEASVWTVNDSEGTDVRRLRLLGVQEFSLDESLSKPSYVLTYEPTPLPRRFSLQRDHWGYYNGQVNNVSLIDDAYIQPRPNRSVSWSFMKAGHLTRLQYPTGGWVDFVFEPHYEDATKVYYKAGLRLANQTENFVQGTPVMTTYEYGNVREPLNVANYGYLFSFAPTVWRTFVSNDWPNQAPIPFMYKCNEGSPLSGIAYLKVYSSNLYGLVSSFIGLSPVYDYVKVRKSGNGYVGYHYGDVFPKNFFNIYPYTSGDLVNYVNNGKLLTEEYFNEANQLQKRVHYTYNTLPDANAPNYGVAYQWERMSACSPGARFVVSSYGYSQIRSLLLEKKETFYDLDGSRPLSQTTRYAYGTAHQQPIREAMDMSNGDSLVVVHRYAKDLVLTAPDYGHSNSSVSAFSIDQLSALQRNNRNMELQTLRYLKKSGENDGDMKAISGRLSGLVYANSQEYSLQTNRIYSLKTLNRVAVQPLSISGNSLFYDANQWEQRALFAYDATTQYLVEENLIGGAKTHYTYGSSGLLTAISRASDTANPHLTSFSQKDFFGLTSTTSPNLVLQSFEYDGLGRLVRIKDSEGNIEKAYEYQYGAVNVAKEHTPLTANTSLSYPRRSLFSYSDGLGSSLQSVALSASGDASQDVISQAVSYDALGRVSKTYIPFSGSASSSVASLPSSVFSDTAPYSEPLLYDNSPLNRVLQTYGAGMAWRSANKFSNYLPSSNVANEIFDIRATGGGFTVVGYYDAQTLFKETKTDEAGHRVWTWKDKEGRLISQWQEASSSVYLKTNYVYDDLGRLAYVIQPELADAMGIGTNILTWYSSFVNHAFAYEYDDRNRVIRKYVPAGGWSSMIYDLLDRVVLEQDARQFFDNQWSFSKYDAFGRVVMQGETVNSSSREVLQNAINVASSQWEENNSVVPFRYTRNTLPQVLDSELQHLNYYDNYDHNMDLPIGIGYTGNDFFNISLLYTNPKGLLVTQYSRQTENASVWEGQSFFTIRKVRSY